MLRNKRILITGATGFIGANLARHFLRKGADISILVRETSNLWRIDTIKKAVSIFYVDLLDDVRLNEVCSMAKPDYIFHAAVYGGYPDQTDVNRIYQTNFLGTVNLLRACNRVGFELFLNFGSSSEYGVKNSPMKEEDSLEPITDYGVSKSASTLYCQSIFRREKKAIVTLRLFSPYGYYETHSRLIPSVIISCLKLKNPQLSSPCSVRDFIFIEDVLQICESVIKNKEEVKGEIFNVGYGHQHSIGDVVKMVIKLTGDKVSPEWEKVTNPRTEPGRWEADISKAKMLLDWQPEYDLPSGLKKTINWLKDNIKLYEPSES